MTKLGASILDGPRLFYEEFVGLYATKRPDAPPLPAFGALTARQYRAWTLAYVANLETGIRMGEAMAALDEEEPA